MDSNKESVESNVFENFSSPPSGFLDFAEDTGIYSFWEWDLEKDRIYLTENISKILCIDKNFISSGEFESLLSPDLNNVELPIRESVLEHKESFSYKLKLQLSGKKEKWITVWGKLHSGGKKVVGLISDITELEQRTLELNESALRAERSQAIAHLGSWEYNADDGTIIWSDETYRIFGKNKDYFIPSFETFLDNVHPEDREMVSQAFNNSVKNKEYGYEIKHRIINAITGNTRWVHEKCFHKWGRDGELICSTGVVLDITDKELLTRKYENFYQAIENSSNAVIITDAEGRIIYSNRAFETLYGYTSEEILGKTPAILNPGIDVYRDYGFSEDDYASTFTAMWKDIVDPEKEHWDGELLNKTKTGETIRVHLYVNAVKNEKGEITSFIGYPIDISSQYLREKEIRFQTIMAIADLAEQRDNETGQHMKRIGLFTSFISEKMGQTTKFCEDIKMFAPLHDIGKVGISDNILLAERKLTDEEFETMKNHTQIGYNILKNRPLMEMAADIALNHQEKYDGSGYPRGISGSDIPLPARITSLADVYDALRSDRPYKEPFSHEKAKTIILEGRGRHFDPDITDLFLEYNRDFEAIYDKLKDQD